MLTTETNKYGTINLKIKGLICTVRKNILVWICFIKIVFFINNFFSKPCSKNYFRENRRGF